MPDYGAASSMGSILSGMINTYSANQIAGIQADTANYIRKDNNVLIDAENKRDATLTSIQRWRQGVFNSRVNEKTVNDQTMLATNFNRMMDARKRASFSDQISYAEQEGRMQAQAAASGVSGSVVDMLNLTMQMKKGVEDTATAETDRLLSSDEIMKEASTRLGNDDRRDQSLIFDNPRSYDYGVTLAPRQSLLTNISGKDVKGVAQGADSYFNFSFNSPPQTDWSGVDYQAIRDN